MTTSPEGSSTKIDTLARMLQKHDPEPYFPGNWEDKAYYREYAAAMIADGLLVITPPARGERCGLPGCTMPGCGHP